MARPGFVLEVDERTPPLVVPDGLGFRLERLPLDTRVVYPAEPLPALPDVGEAIDQALDAPLESAPLTTLLRGGMRLCIAFDDTSTPVPRMRRPDIRGRIIEAVLRRAAAAGVDDVVLIAARGLNRRLTAPELEQVVGERVFRSFFADGQLRLHDADDADQLSEVGSTDAGELRLNTAAASADLLVFVHLAGAGPGGALAVATGLGSTATIGQLATASDPLGPASPAEVTDRVGQALTRSLAIFQIEAVLDNAAYAAPLEFLSKREWEWTLQDRAVGVAMRRGLALASTKTRRRLLRSAQAAYAPVSITAGAPGAVAAASAVTTAAQRVVEVPGQADVAILGVPDPTPYSVDSVTNPVLAAWSALAAAFGAHTGRPLVREGGALIVYHPLAQEFSPLHHPSYVDFFAEVLPTTTDAVQIQDKFEEKFAGDPWYSHLYRTSYAFHGVHPMHRWYDMAAARAHCGDIIFVGANRPTAARLGVRAASTLADALEIVSSTVGRAPVVSYLHGPSQLVADVR